MGRETTTWQRGELAHASGRDRARLPCRYPRYWLPNILAQYPAPTLGPVEAATNKENGQAYQWPE
jgi:hypothetical protein